MTPHLLSMLMQNLVLFSSVTIPDCLIPVICISLQNRLIISSIISYALFLWLQERMAGPSPQLMRLSRGQRYCLTRTYLRSTDCPDLTIYISTRKLPLLCQKRYWSSWQKIDESIESLFTIIVVEYIFIVTAVVSSCSNSISNGSSRWEWQQNLQQ